LAREILVLEAPFLALEIRKLELLPEPIDDIVDPKLQHELVPALVIAAFALLVALLGARRDENVAGLTLALSYAARRIVVAQPKAVVLEEADGYAQRARGAAPEHVELGDELGKLR